MQLLHTYNFRWFGIMAYCMPLILFLLPCFIISNWHNSGLIQKVAASILLFLSIETILSIQGQQVGLTCNLLDGTDDVLDFL